MQVWTSRMKSNQQTGRNKQPGLPPIIQANKHRDEQHKQTNRQKHTHKFTGKQTNNQTSSQTRQQTNKHTKQATQRTNEQNKEPRAELSTSTTVGPYVQARERKRRRWGACTRPSLTLSNRCRSCGAAHHSTPLGRSDKSKGQGKAAANKVCRTDWCLAVAPAPSSNRRSTTT